MSPEERDQKILETHIDVKYIKEWVTEHKAVHNRYTYYFICTVIALLISLIK